MAISPMQLPSPKAYDPNQAEITNLVGFRDPYTADRASINADNFRADRLASGEQYQHALDRQQQYYSKALDLQAEESANELLPKLLHEQHGIGFASGIRGLQGVLERMQQANPGLYGQYVNQAFQGEKAKALQAGGAGAKSALEAGLQTPPSEFYGATGVGTNAVTPLSLQEAAIHAASSGGGGAAGGSSTIQVPIFTGPDGKEWTVSYSPPKGAGQAEIFADMVRKGYMNPDGSTPRGGATPPAGAVPAGNKPTAGGKPGVSTPTPPTTGLQPKPNAPTAKGGAPTSGGVISEQQWDAGKGKLVSPAHREMAAQVEAARKANGGKLMWSNGRLVGMDKQGNRQTYGVPG